MGTVLVARGDDEGNAPVLASLDYCRLRRRIGILTVAITGLGSGRRSSSRRPHAPQDLINSSDRGSHEYSVPYHVSTCSVQIRFPQDGDATAVLISAKKICHMDTRWADRRRFCLNPPPPPPLPAPTLPHPAWGQSARPDLRSFALDHHRTHPGGEGKPAGVGRPSPESGGQPIARA